MTAEIMRNRLCKSKMVLKEVFRVRCYQITIFVIIIFLQCASAFCPVAPSTSTAFGTSLRPSSTFLSASSMRDIDYLIPEHDGFPVEVSYEGMTCKFDVRPNETILSALERTGAGDSLCLPSIPHDCRKGACLTCSGKHAPGSRVSNLSNYDSLTQSTSEDVQNAGYVLICSSFVLGEGVKLELGQNCEAWDDIHRKRFMTEEAQLLGRAATLNTMRRAAERKVEKWKKETYEMFKLTPDNDLPFQ